MADRSDLEDGNDAGVPQRGGRLGFAHEARARLRIGCQIVAQHLDRHVSAKRLVATSIDGAHRAFPEQPVDNDARREMLPELHQLVLAGARARVGVAARVASRVGGEVRATLPAARGVATGFSATSGARLRRNRYLT